MYTWDFGDGRSPQVGGVIMTYTYAAAGTFYPKLTVTDTHGDGDVALPTSLVVNITSDPLAAPPTARFTTDTNNGVAPLTVNFDASTSTDPNVGTLTFSWDFGDGTAQVSGVNVAHVFASAGPYTVRLTATDNSLKTNATSSTVTATPLNCDVRAGSFSNPAANATANDVKATAGVPVNTSFAFSATTNDACTSIVAQLFYSDGTAFSVVLATATDIAGVKTWLATVSSTQSFSLGTGQSADVYDSVAGTTLTFSYSVHT
jgi:PKD repeat protein